MAKKFVRTTKPIWDSKTDKSEYLDSIVFIEDSGEIWSNGQIYGSVFQGDNNKLLKTDSEGHIISSVLTEDNGTISSNDHIELSAPEIKITTNGSSGDNGDILMSDGSKVYWGNIEENVNENLNINIFGNESIYNGLSEVTLEINNTDVINVVNNAISDGEIVINVDQNEYEPGEGIGTDGPIIYLKEASLDELGGIRTGYSTNTNQKNYAVELDPNGHAFVNVPWTAGDSEPVNNIRYAEPSSDFTGIDANGSLIDSVLIKGAQTLTSDEKTQVLTNLGIEDTAVGIKVLSGVNYSGIKPNCLYLFGTLSSNLHLSLISGDGSIVNEYMIQFSTGDTVPSLLLPNTIVWQTEPVLQPNKTYQISIINNLGVIGEF